jgi:hypothetical protein
MYTAVAGIDAMINGYLDNMEVRTGTHRTICATAATRDV